MIFLFKSTLFLSMSEQFKSIHLQFISNISSNYDMTRLVSVPYLSISIIKYLSTASALWLSHFHVVSRMGYSHSYPYLIFTFYFNSHVFMSSPVHIMSSVVLSAPIQFFSHLLYTPYRHSISSQNFPVY